MVNDLQARLHSLYNARQPVGSVHGQMVGQERYKLIASGEQLYTLLEASDRIAVLEAALLDLYSGTAEYVYLNHLGDPHNTTPMRNAAKALGAPALEAYDRLRALYSTSDANVGKG